MRPNALIIPPLGRNFKATTWLFRTQDHIPVQLAFRLPVRPAGLTKAGPRGHNLPRTSPNSPGAFLAFPTIARGRPRFFCASPGLFRRFHGDIAGPVPNTHTRCRRAADSAGGGLRRRRPLRAARPGSDARRPCACVEASGATAFLMPIAEIQTARNEPLVGGGRLEITAKGGDILPVITYSQTVAAQFSEAARGIEQLAKGEPLSINLKPERTRCPKCGRLLPEKDGICPACVNRGKTMLRIAGFLDALQAAGRRAGPDGRADHVAEPRPAADPAQPHQRRPGGAPKPGAPVRVDGRCGWASSSPMSASRS